MSLTPAQAFIREIIADPSFRDEVEDADGPQQRLNLARKRGFDFTQPELEDAVTEVASAKTVGDLLGINPQVADDRLAHTLGVLVDLQNDQLQPHYAHGPDTPGHCDAGQTADDFCNKDGKVKLLDVNPPQKTVG